MIDLKVSKLRKLKGITQSELAEVLGVSCQAVSKWETDVSMPDITLLPVIADYFHVSIDELLGVKPLSNLKYISRGTGDSSYWEDKSKYFEDTREFFWNKDYLRFLIRDVWKLTSPVNIIDFGCGAGHMGLAILDLLPNGSTYTGIDSSENLINEAKERFKELHIKAEFIATDIIDFNPKSKYDVAICQAFLRHINNPVKALETMIDSVTNGGSVICVEVNRVLENAGFYVEGIKYEPSRKGTLLQKIWDLENEVGERDHSIGFKVPMYMDRLGLKDIDVRMNDKVSLMLPTHEDYAVKRDKLLSSNGWSNHNVNKSNETIELLKSRGFNQHETNTYLGIEKEIVEFFNRDNKSRMLKNCGLVISRGVKK